MDLELWQANLGGGQLTVVAGRLLGRPKIGGAGLLSPPGRFGGAALPIAGPRQRGRVDAADPDPRKMLRGERGVVEEAQRDPARGEFLLRLVDVAGGKRGVAGDQIGGTVVSDVGHVSRPEAAL